MSIPALILLVAQWQHDRPFIDQIHEAEHLRLEGKSTRAEGILRGAVNSGCGSIGERGTAANNLAALLARHRLVDRSRRPQSTTRRARNEQPGRRSRLP